MSSFRKIFIISFCLLIPTTLFLGLMLPIKAEKNQPDTSPYFYIKELNQIDIDSRYFSYDRNNQIIYVSVPDGAENYENSLVLVDAVTGAILENPIYVGNDPDISEIAHDSSLLYVSLVGDKAIRRVNLISKTAEIQFPLGGGPGCNGGYYSEFQAEDIVIQESSPETVIISRRNIGCSPRHEGVVVYDNGTARSLTTQDHSGSNRIEPSNVVTQFYGFNNETSEFGFRHLIVNNAGIIEQDVIPNLINGYHVDITYHNGYIYTTNGNVINPTTNSQVGNYIGANGPLTIDTSTNSIFFVNSEINNFGFYSLSLEVFKLDTFEHIASIPVPQQVRDSPRKLEYLMPNKLALLTTKFNTYILEIGQLDYSSYMPIVMKNYCAGPYVDDFSNPATGWPSLSTGTIEYRYLNNEYNIFHYDDDRWAAVSRGDYWSNSRLVEIHGRITSNEGVWGLVFGLNDDWTDFYTFEILPHEQTWIILHFNNANGWSLVANGRDNIIKSGTQLNKLSISQTIGLMQMQINDSIVYNFNQQIGRVGLSGGSFDKNVDIRYDDYIFVNEHCPLPSQMTFSTSHIDTLSLNRPPIETLLTNTTD